MKKYKVLIQEKARIDIQEAANYYETQSKGLGRRFVSHIAQTSAGLKLSPYLQIKYDVVRCVRVSSFPYALHYTVNETNHKVIE